MRCAFVALIIAYGVFAQTPASQSFRAFQSITPVLRHPRCLNCHIPGNAPLIGDHGHTHPMNVKRGADGEGTAIMRCSNCHQETNSLLPHSPPGTHDWKLPPAKTRMAWVGLSDEQLCRSIISRATNGGLSNEKLLHHMETDSRVLWSWNPGPGRTLPPMTHQEFLTQVRGWVANGASCATQ